MNTPKTKTYEARYLANASVTFDGKLASPVWEQANLETGFSFPWEQRPAPRTEFRAFSNETALHFGFRVEDDDIVLAENFRNKEDVVFEDRVELFFSLDEDLRDYFCLEIDPLGRVLDYRAAYHRKLDFSWSFPGVEAIGISTDEGYAVQGRIPWSSFSALGFPSPNCGETIQFGIYRAEFRHTEPGQWSESWISWVDPETSEPDFHIPQSFGYLKI